MTNRLVLVLALGAAVAIAFLAPVAGHRLSDRVLLPGTPFETPVWVVSGEESGPTVLVVGGVHGNEPAGSIAAHELRAWPIRGGTLVLLPRANVPALAAGTREIPGVSGELADLNRCFPRGSDDAPHGPVAEGIWQFVEDVKPDWLIDLHEGIGFARQSSETVGSSVIAGHEPEVVDESRRLIERVNSEIDDGDRRFVLRQGPVPGSLARAASEELGVRAMILETTSRDQPLSLRVRQHRVLLERLLLDLGLLDDERVLPRFVSGDGDGAARVAVWDDEGADPEKVAEIEERLVAGGCAIRRVGREDVRDDSFGGFEVVVFAGGRAGVTGRALGIVGRDAIESFVRRGGGYIGIGAGAYLATREYDWSLGILDASVASRTRWRRGSGEVAVLLTEAGRALAFGSESVWDRSWSYENGPLLAPANEPELPDFTALALYETEIAEGDVPRGVMAGTPVLVSATLGKGRVVAAGAELPASTVESREEDPLLSLILWAAGKRDAREPKSSGATETDGNGAGAEKLANESP